MSLFIDPNNVDFLRNWISVGIASVVQAGKNLEFRAEVTSEVEGTDFLIIDAAGRFVATCRANHGPVSFTVPDACLSRATWPVSVYFYNERLNTAYPICDLTSPVPEKSAPPVPSYKGTYEQAIVEAMRHPYTSLSSKDGIKTGNGYQSITLNSLTTEGGRPHRNLFFNHIDFKGKSILDIGANTGELSRLARLRGADLVDGYEYDPFFVETGRMINGATGMTRVSLFQGDATKKEFYDGKKFDMVMTFAVWVYTSQHLERIADITDIVLFETHTLDHGLEMYTEPMSRYFPQFRIIGYDEKQDMRKSRCVLLFAKTKSQLDATLRVHTVTSEKYFNNHYFENNGFTTPSGFKDHASAVRKRVLKETPEINGLGTAYLELFVAGYHEFCEVGQLNRQNVFVREYTNAIQEGRLDPNLKYLLEDEFLLLQKISRKFDDISNMVSGNLHLVAPPIIRPGEGKMSFRKINGEIFSAVNIDGHHRFFIWQLLGYPAVEVLLRDPLLEKTNVVNTNYKIA